MTTYVTSDTHFGHERIINLCNRPFVSVDHMNDEIVRRWNEVVTPDDTVIHLGDVALGKIDNSLAVVSRLNGYKILVNGNHDRPFMNRGKARFDEWNDRYAEVFDYIAGGTSYNWTFSDGTAVVLSHFPYDGDNHDKDRYTDDRPLDNGTPLIHGHTHMNNRVSRSARGTLQIHVGQDAWDYRPVSEDEILSLLR